MPAVQNGGILQYISMFMLALDIAKAILIVYILFRGVVLINVFIKKYRVTDNKNLKDSRISAVSEKPVEAKKPKTLDAKEMPEKEIKE